jgi:hypothetical protein
MRRDHSRGLTARRGSASQQRFARTRKPAALVPTMIVERSSRLD